MAKNTQVLSLENYVKQFGRKLDIYKCFQSSDNIGGRSQILVVRTKKNGKLILGSFLVDTYCLGVEEAFFEEYDYPEEMEEVFVDEHGFQEISADLAFNYVYGALEYAEDLGLKPCKDYKDVKWILDDVDDFEYIEIEFGLNGMPCYIHGEYDKPMQVLQVLNKTVGKDGYLYYKSIEDFIDAEDGDEDEFGEDDFDDDNEFGEDDLGFSDFMDGFEDDGYNPYFSELKQYREQSIEEFSNLMQKRVLKFNKAVLVEIVVFNSIVLQVGEIFNYSNVYEEYISAKPELTSKLTSQILKKFEKTDLYRPKLIEYFTKIALQNYVRCSGVHFVALKDFRKGFEGFLEGNRKNINEVFYFMLLDEFKRANNFLIIANKISEKIFNQDDFEKLNDFQKNRVADEILVRIEENATLELPDEWEFLEDYLDEYEEIVPYFPEISDEELKALILQLSGSFVQQYELLEG